MGAVLSGLGATGITALELLLIAGFAVALLRVATGHRDGCGPLLAFLVALAALDLWQGGWLSGLASPLLPGASSPGSGALP